MQRTSGVGRLAACLLACGLWAAACGGGDGPGVDTRGGDVATDLADPGTDPGVPDDGPRPDVPPVDPGSDAPPPVDVAGDPGPACPEGRACDDGDPCTFGDACGADGTCAGTAAAGCDDDVDCTFDACTAADACTHAVKPGWCLVDGLCWADGQASPTEPCKACLTALAQDAFLPDDSRSCDDGDGCTKGDACRDGACVPGPAGCDDGNPCTTDACTDRQCVNTPLDAGACDDGDLCTAQDACVAGACKGVALTCDDGNDCTTDECDPARGCVRTAREGACDDGNACTTGDACVDGRCRSGDVPLACSDGNPCTDDGCVPHKGCVFIPNAADCQDGDPCTVGDTCRAGRCTAGPDELPCDDGNVCTDDRCVAGTGCAFTPNAAPCDDGDPCTLDDFCGGGGCQAGPGDLDCDDGNVCTDDSCEPGNGCVHRPNTVRCNDLNDCTVEDVCAGGTCLGQLIPGTCDDGDDCTGDFCTTSKGCRNIENDYCQTDGTCAMEGVPCTPGGCGHKTLPECRPSILIDFPPRGATLDPSSAKAGTTGTITVRGHIQPGKSGAMVPYLSVNGVPLIPDAVTGAFQTDIVSVQGLNPIVVDVQDILGGKDHLVQSYYFSSQWYDVDQAAPQKSQVEDGLMLFLGPEVWDDNDTKDVDDIATIMTLYIAELDLSTLIKNPVTSGSFGWCDYKVNVYHMRYGPPAVDLVPVEGGLKMHAVIRNFYADVDVPISGFGCPDFSGSVTASTITIDTTLLISLDPVTHQPVIAMSGTDVAINGLNINLNGAWGFLLNWLIDFFEGTFSDQIATAFEDQIAALVPALRDALSGLAINTDFDIPAFFPGGSPVTLGLRSRLSSIEFHPSGGTVGLAATIVAPHGVSHPVLGSIGRAACLTGAVEPKPTFPAGSPLPKPPALEIGLHDDFFNLIPYALYWAGSLTLPVPASLLGGVDLSSYGITDMNLMIDLWLPPILSACNEKAKLMMQMGDVGVKVDMKLFGSPVQMQLYATMEAEADLAAVDGVAGKELAIAVQQPTFIDVEIASLAGGLVNAEETLGNLIRTVLMPQLLGALTGQTLASFPLPEFDLSGMMAGLPPDTKLAIEIREVLRRGAYNIASGNVK